MSHYTHLVISGGGMCGGCILGVFRYLYIENKIKNIKYISGNSIGSIFALAFILKIPLDELEIIFKDIHKNREFIINKNNLGNLFINNGIIDFNIIIKPIQKYLKDNYDLDDITFKEISKKFGINLYISTTNVNRQINKIFSIDNTPDISVFKAVTASITLPYIGIPVIIDNEYYIDGYLTNNFPIEVFKNVNKDNIFGIVINIETNNSDNNINKELTFIDYNKKLLDLLIINTSKLAFINLINKEYANILLINDLPISSYILYSINNDELESDLSDIDVDNLILDGFIKTSNYFNYIKNL